MEKNTEKLLQETYILFEQHKYAEAVDLLFSHIAVLRPFLEMEARKGYKSPAEQKLLANLAYCRANAIKRLKTLGLIPCTDKEIMDNVLEGIIFQLSSFPQSCQIIYSSKN